MTGGLPSMINHQTATRFNYTINFRICLNTKIYD